MKVKLSDGSLRGSECTSCIITTTDGTVYEISERKEKKQYSLYVYLSEGAIAAVPTMQHHGLKLVRLNTVSE